MRSARSVPAGIISAPRTRCALRAAFYTPLLSNWDNYETWQERGQIDAAERANTHLEAAGRRVRAAADRPGIDEALKDYVARRKLEIGHDA